MRGLWGDDPQAALSLLLAGKDTCCLLSCEACACAVEESGVRSISLRVCIGNMHVMFCPRSSVV